MSEYYYRVTKTLNDRGALVAEEDFPAFMEKVLLQDPNIDYYRSLYVYPEEVLDYWKTHNNSIKGYKGGFSNQLTFDFDCEQNLLKARDDVRNLLNKIKTHTNLSSKEISEATYVYFSGNKGFHVHICLTEYLPQANIEAICKHLGSNLSTFDTSIYNDTRIFRCNNTKHQKSGLWAVPLDLSTFKELTVEQIKEVAKQPSTVNVHIPVAIKVEVFEGLKVQKVEEQVVVEVEEDDIAGKIRGLVSVPFDECPRSVPRCLFAIQRGVMVPGHRNKVMLALARYYRNAGYPKELAHHTLKGIAELNSKLHPEADPITRDEIWLTVINSAYGQDQKEHTHPDSPGTKAEDEVLLKYCREIDAYTNRPCCLHKRVLTKEVYDSDSMAIDFSAYAKNIDKNIIKTGIDFVDETAIISRGEITTLVGSVGSGKTSISLNLLEYASSQNIPAIFISLDMVKFSLYIKLALRCTPYSMNQIKWFYKNDPKKAQEITEIVRERFKSVYFLFNSTFTMQEIQDKILELNATKKIDTGLVILDYFSRVSSDFSDQFASLNYSALQAKNVADVTNTALVLISQISRGNGDGSTPLRNARCSKGTGTIDEISSVILNCWRPFMNQKDSSKDRYMRLYCSKSRMGCQQEGLLRWEGKTGRVYNMSPEELEEYAMEIEPLEEEIYKNKGR